MSQTGVGEESGANVVWLTGLPSAGKTTIGRILHGELIGRKVECELLDGDELRKTISSDLGYSPEDRETHVMRVAELADQFSNQGVAVIVAVIAPYRSLRRQLRQLLGERYIEVYVDTPLAVCQARDEKGLYQQARQGTVSGLTGVGDPYEVPTDPHLVISTESCQPAESADHVLALLERRSRIPARARAA